MSYYYQKRDVEIDRKMVGKWFRGVYVRHCGEKRESSSCHSYVHLVLGKNQNPNMLYTSYSWDYTFSGFFYLISGRKF